MIYKTVVTEKETKKKMVIESDYFYKKNFIEDLRANGYSVNDREVFEKEFYDWCLENTNCDFKHYLEDYKKRYKRRWR